MSLRFSEITMTSGNERTVFLTGGVPQNIKDLAGWKYCDDFLGRIDDGNKIIINVDSYLYGDDSFYDATPEEIAYFYKRIEMKPDFIEKRTTKCGSSSFVFSK